MGLSGMGPSGMGLSGMDGAKWEDLAHAPLALIAYFLPKVPMRHVICCWAVRRRALTAADRRQTTAAMHGAAVRTVAAAHQSVPLNVPQAIGGTPCCCLRGPVPPVCRRYFTLGALGSDGLATDDLFCASAFMCALRPSRSANLQRTL